MPSLRVDIAAKDCYIEHEFGNSYLQQSILVSRSELSSIAKEDRDITRLMNIYCSNAPHIPLDGVGSCGRHAHIERFAVNLASQICRVFGALDSNWSFEFVVFSDQSNARRLRRRFLPTHYGLKRQNSSAEQTASDQNFDQMRRLFQVLSFCSKAKLVF